MEITSVSPFLAYWARVHERTARVVGIIPPALYEWRPEPQAFSFADLVRHLAAIERYMFVENVCGRSSRYPGHGPDLADTPAAVHAYYHEKHEESVRLVSALADAELLLPCTTPGGATLARGKWLRSMLEHEVHHRGQIYLMLHLNHVATPPLYGLTSEEVRERSRVLLEVLS